MSKFIKFELENGGSVLIEVDSKSVTTGVQPVASNSEGVISTAKAKFEETLSVLTPVVTAIFSKFNDAIKSPHEVTVEFGLKLSGKGNLIITSTEGEVTFKTTLHWKKSD